MTADVLARDLAFRQWLAARPGLWLEVGAFDDTGQLVALMAERRRLGLPPIAERRAAQGATALRRPLVGKSRSPMASGMTIGGHA